MKEKKCRHYRKTKKYFLKFKRKCRCFYCFSNRQYRNLKRSESVHIGNVGGFSDIILLITRRKFAGLLDVRQRFSTQSATKFIENTCADAYVDRFSISAGEKMRNWGDTDV